MSTFGGIVEDIEGISVDRFDGANLRSRAFFLSHCHTDHMNGIFVPKNYYKLNPDFLKSLEKTNEIFMYASEITCLILKNLFPELQNYLKVLSINETHNIKIPGSITDTFITIRLISAGHCPGSVMFLFKTLKNKTILYTGDFRVSPACLPKMRGLHDADNIPITIDKMYLDTTFCREDYQSFPSRKESCDIICDSITEWISKGINYLVVLDIPANYGSEFLFKEIADAAGSSIHVRDFISRTYRCIAEMDNIFTSNGDNIQIHSCKRGGHFNKKISLDCRNTQNCHVRYIKPSALRWNNNEIEKNQSYAMAKDENVYICYSSHCSFEELKAFLQYFKPKEVEPCVVPSFGINFFNKALQSICPKYRSDRQCEQSELPKSFVDTNLTIDLTQESDGFKFHRKRQTSSLRHIEENRQNISVNVAEKKQFKKVVRKKMCVLPTGMNLFD